LALESDAEVLVTGFTCEVVPNAVLQAGYKPCYVDIDPASFCTDPLSVESRINEKTRVLVIQHSFGIAAPIDELMAIARRHNLFVIEDCAVSLGTHYYGRPTGTWGDAAIYSFELSKVITLFCFRRNWNFPLFSLVV
jgi:dTDP-4-amino-4,6-dideoxygalactose transaminase